LAKLLRRGTEIRSLVRGSRPADLALQTVLRPHERIEQFEVQVDGEPQRLIEREICFPQKLDLLEGAICASEMAAIPSASTVCVHLAECLEDRSA
jgi:hypothetical protein